LQWKPQVCEQNLIHTPSACGGVVDLRINQNYSLSFIEASELFKVGTGAEAGEYRVVNFCSLESRK
jgi:hypothetical protein